MVLILNNDNFINVGEQISSHFRKQEQIFARMKVP